MTQATLVERTAEVVGHRFRDENLLQMAITHASSADTRLESNERMEFLGDAILGYVVCNYLFDNYPDLLEGDLTKIKSAVVSRRVCAMISEELGLCSLMNLGKGMSGRAKLPGSIAAAALEAIIAALYIDTDIETARAFVLKCVKPYIEEAAASAHQQNFKSVLQQYAQKHLPDTPSYILLDEKGPDHAKAFEVCAEINGQRFASAWAQSKKQAEQEAALNALRELNLVHDDDAGNVQLREPTT